MNFYRAYIDIKGPNVTDDEMTDYMVTTPNVEWKYKRLQYKFSNLLIRVYFPM